jgi:uncharacterized protein (TIGR04255 family)
MRFPESERVIYAQNPLVEVICQARFNRLLRLETEVPAAFQLELIESYPVLRETNTLSGALPPQLAQLVGLEPGTVGQRAFDFISEDGAWRVSITSHFVALSATDYRRWDDFRPRFAKVLDAFVKVYGISTFTRLGLRYRDLIQRSKLGLQGREWSELLSRGVAGELREKGFEKDAKHVGKELVLDLDFDSASVRLYHGFARVQDSSENCYLIDADFFREVETERVDAEAILDRFNREAGKLFRWAIADPLHEAMGPQRVT